MLDVHIDDFFKDCSAILLAGMSHFPRPFTLFVEDISGPDNMDEFGLHSNRHLAALGTVHWLAAEGYIRFSTQDRQESVDDFVLTEKAFKRMLAPLAETIPAGSRSRTSENPTPLFQALEFCHLQQDSTMMRSLLQLHFLQR